MKKVLVAVAIFAGASIMTSCKKDYTCTCTIEEFGISVSITEGFEDMKKKDAKAKCEDEADGEDGVTCELS